MRVSACTTVIASFLSIQVHCPELTLYFECWLPHPQTVDTELLSQRLAEYQYCLPEHMHGFCPMNLLSEHSDQTILQRTEIATMQLNYTNHIDHIISINHDICIFSQPG